MASNILCSDCLPSTFDPPAFTSLMLGIRTMFSFAHLYIFIHPFLAEEITLNFPDVSRMQSCLRMRKNIIMGLLFITVCQLLYYSCAKTSRPRQLIGRKIYFGFMVPECLQGLFLETMIGGRADN